MVLKLLLNTRMIWIIFMKIVKNGIQIRNKKRKILVVFNGMIADMTNSKKLNQIVTELFIRVRKLYIFHVFITQSYFAVPKNESFKK